MLPALARGCREAAGSVGMLMAHGVHETRAGGTAPPSSSTLVEALEANILGRMRGYRFVSLARAVDSLQGGRPLPERCLVLTFDDSLGSLARLAAPRLSSWGITATFYLSTDAIDRGESYWWLRLEDAWPCLAAEGNEAVSKLLPPSAGFRAPTLPLVKRHFKGMAPAEAASMVDSLEEQAGIRRGQCAAGNPHAAVMSWSDVRRIRDLGMSIGCHTVTHPDLTKLGADALAAELSHSKRRIEEETGHPCLDFCYPFGSYSEPVVAAVRAAGFRSAVTTDGPGWNAAGSDPHLLRRFPLSGVPNRMCFELSGLRRAS